MKFVSALGAFSLSALAVAIAPVAYAAPPPLEAYGELPTMEQMVLSPSGQNVATIMRINGKRYFLVLDADRKPLSKLEVGDVKVRDIDFITDTRVMMVRSATQKLNADFAQAKYEFYQAMIIDIAQGTADVVFSDRANLVDSTFGSYGRRIIDGRPKAYFGAVELQRASFSSGYQFEHGRPALYEVDLLTNKSRRVDSAPGEGYERDWLVGDTGDLLARFEMDRGSGEWTIRNGASQVIARGKDPLGRAGLVMRGKDPGTIIYAEFVGENGKGGSSRWYELAVDGSGKPTEFLPDTDTKRIFTDRASGMLIGYITDEDQPKTVFFDPAKAKNVALARKTFAPFNPELIDWTADFNKVLIHTGGNQDSGTYFLLDVAGKRANAVGYERLAITPDQVGKISTVPYKAADGMEMDGILTLPPGREAKGLPLVVLPHGGPHSHDTEGFDWWAQAFASRGYAVFQPNFRGSTGRGSAFIQAGYGQWGRKMQTDISDGVAKLAADGTVDPKRACIVGASYGGYAALAGVTLQQGLYRCAVSVAGVTDLSLMTRVEQRESGNSRLQERSLEEELGPRSELKTFSPRFLAAKADAPVLLIHGRDDTVVDYLQSKKMEDALRDAGKPVEMVTLESEDHWLSRGETRQAMLKAAVSFVEKHNPAN